MFLYVLLIMISLKESKLMIVKNTYRIVLVVLKLRIINIIV